jgi:predicted sulfurtransferase
MTAMADGGAFVFDNRMADYGAEPTSERPTDEACERRFMADLGLMQLA